MEGIRLSSKLKGHSGIRNTLWKDDLTGLLSDLLGRKSEWYTDT